MNTYAQRTHIVFTKDTECYIIITHPLLRRLDSVGRKWLGRSSTEETVTEVEEFLSDYGFGKDISQL